MWPRVTCDGRNLKKTARSILFIAAVVGPHADDVPIF